MPTKDLPRAVTSSSDSSFMANATVVPKNDAHDRQESSFASSEDSETAFQTTSLSPITQESQVNSLSFIRRFFQERKFSEQAINIMCASWRNSTQLQYKLYIEKWIHFCNRQKINPMCYNEVNCIQFSFC